MLCYTLKYSVFLTCDFQNFFTDISHKQYILNIFTLYHIVTVKKGGATMYSNKPSILACVTGQYDCDRIIETAAAIAEEQECELRVLSVLRPTEDYSKTADVLEYLHRVSKANGADMTVIFSAYAPAAAAQFVNDNNVSRIVTGMHDGGNESFLVMFNRFAPDVSITMVAKDNIVYSMDIARAGAR